jgi:hypothetical protein
VGEPASEPSTKRHYMVAFHLAAGEIWGDDGLADIRARMPRREAEEAFVDRLPYWVPERVVIAWCFALWEGVALRSREPYVAWLHRMTELSFGPVRRTFLRMASLERLFEMSGRLWKDDHTSGEMEGHCEGKRGVFLLRDHPYTETPQARATLAEQLRYLLERSGVKNVAETHARHIDGALEVKLRWP